MVKIIVMAIIGTILGYFVPMLAQKLIEYKSKKKNKIYQARIFYILLVFGVSYLVTNFLYDFLYAFK